MERVITKGVQVCILRHPPSHFVKPLKKAWMTQGKPKVKRRFSQVVSPTPVKGIQVLQLHFLLSFLLHFLFFIMYSRKHKSTPNPCRGLLRLSVVTGNFFNAKPLASQTCQESSSFLPQACDSDGTKKENEFYGALTFFLSSGNCVIPGDVC